MAVRKALAQKFKQIIKDYVSKGKPATRAKNIGDAYKSGKTDLAYGFAKKAKRRDKVVGAATGIAGAYGIKKFKESPYKIDISISKRDDDKISVSTPAKSKSSDYKAKAAKVNEARTAQVKANEAKVKANKQMTTAKSNKTKVAANKAKVDANKTMVEANKKKVEANKKKVEANKTRYKS